MVLLVRGGVCFWSGGYAFGPGGVCFWSWGCLLFKRPLTHSFHLIPSTDDFRWIREVFMSSTIGFRRMGRKLDMEKDDKFTLHLLETRLTSW